MIALALAMLAVDVRAQQPPPQVASEIEYLFAALETSGCEFQRNGSWHSAQRAAQHLRRKYDYLRGKRLVPTTAAFIERAGTQSSTTGRAYRVRCPGKPEIASKTWFEQRLAARGKAR